MLRKVKGILVSCLCVMMLLSTIDLVHAASCFTVHIQGTYDYSAANKVLELVNKERVKEGVAPLKMDKDLLNAAMVRAGEITVDFSHTRPNGEDCYSASSKMNGENIEGGASSPEEVMQDWMNSPMHASNIMYKKFTSVGIGVYRYGNTYFWTQCFGSGQAIDEVSLSGQKSVKQSVSILSSSAEFYAYEVKNSGNDLYMIPGEDGYLQYGILNNGWDGRYAQIQPEDVNFATSNANIISIDAQGKFMAKGSGTATLKVALKADASKFYKCTIVVKAQLINESSTEIKNLVLSYPYTGNPIQPKPAVYCNAKLLKEGTDYTLTYNNNTNAGIATLTITGKGNYTGSISTKFQITRPSTLKANASKTQYAYDGKAHSITVNAPSGSSVYYRTSTTQAWSTAKPTRTSIGTTVIYYKVSHPNYANIVTGNTSVTILQKDWTPIISNYNGAYDVKNHSIAIGNIPAGSTVLYRTTPSGTWTKTKPSRMNCGSSLVYYQITNPNYKTKSGFASITIAKVSTSKLSIAVPASAYVYTGKNIQPLPVVKLGNTTLVLNKDYKVTYSSNKNVGKATLTVTGINNFACSVNKPFHIVPKPPTNLNTRVFNSGNLKALQITFAKATGATGYQVSYCQKGKTTWTSVNTQNNSTIFRGLAANQTLQIKVRSYIKIDNKTVYGNWTSVREVVTK